VDGTTATLDARGQILAAAGRLFAEKGIGASLREISRAAGQGNTRAAQYHFGDRLGLVLAVMAPRRAANEVRRHELLDEYEQAGVPDLRALAMALVVPLAANLDDPDGRRHLRISADYFLNTPRRDVIRRAKPDRSIVRWHRLLDELADESVRADPFQRFAPRISAICVAAGHPHVSRDRHPAPAIPPVDVGRPARAGRLWNDPPLTMYSRFSGRWSRRTSRVGSPRTTRRSAR
jgi:AcrR family transcriptional regulator